MRLSFLFTLLILAFSFDLGAKDWSVNSPPDMDVGWDVSELLALDFSVFTMPADALQSQADQPETVNSYQIAATSTGYEQPVKQMLRKHEPIYLSGVAVIKNRLIPSLANREPNTPTGAGHKPPDIVDGVDNDCDYSSVHFGKRHRRTDHDRAANPVGQAGLISFVA